MHVQTINQPLSRLAPLLLSTAFALITGCGGGGTTASTSATNTASSAPPSSAPSSAPAASVYSQSKLVSDGRVAATFTDTNLVNPWGLVFATGAPVWIANNGTQTSTIYNGIGATLRAPVTIPAGINGLASPTGIVAYGGTEFVVSAGGKSGAAKFIFAGEGGTISGWSSAVAANNAVVMYDDGTGGAVYKGLAIATDATNATRLYAADFHNNKVVVFDSTWAKTTTTGGFVDPTLPAGYAPFGIQTLTVNSQILIYVAYAKQDTGAHDDVAGAGLGLVNVFDTQGTLKTHLIPVGGALNAPWGIGLAPAAGFGTLSSKLLIGNFGDGVINAYDPTAGTFVATLLNSTSQPLAIPGLWGIAFGNGAQNQPTTTLYFTAGPGAEADGLYGRIDLGATPPDVVAPTVAITLPAPNATVTGVVGLTATAGDNVGVTAVRFMAGTTVLGTASIAPFAVSWDTTTTAAGPVSLTAQAFDAAGNSTTSAAVAVTVTH